jgi:hypothetical protein
MRIIKHLAKYTVPCITLVIIPLVVPAYEKNLLLENQTIDTGADITVAALHTITAGPAYVVESGAHASFLVGKQPGDKIVLRPGFRVLLGGSFRASGGDMSGCDIRVTERWNRNHYINGDLVIHPAASLTISSGSEVVFVSEANASLKVRGELSAEGVTFTSSSPVPGAWNGIVVDDKGVAAIFNSLIEYGRQGIVAKSGSEVTLVGCTLRNNIVGVHVIGGDPSILGNSFFYNSWYGVKEDAGGSPRELKHNTFSQNGNSYYNYKSGVISVELLNAFSGNWGNVER